MKIEQTVSAAVAGLELGNTFALDDLLHTVQDRRRRHLRVEVRTGNDTYSREIWAEFKAAETKRLDARIKDDTLTLQWR